MKKPMPYTATYQLSDNEGHYQHKATKGSKEGHGRHKAAKCDKINSEKNLKKSGF
jgi:hypothetical protein